uniref:Integrase n=1 Tax=Geobacter metallireducens TaxID=28232 RepID=A0A831XNC0_GEOME
MRGSPVYQVHKLFSQSGISRIGHSKHEAKEVIRAQYREEGRPCGWHELGQRMGIHSYSTADAYRDVWRQILEHARGEFGVRDIERLTGEHVSSFLERKISESVAYSTFQQYAAAAEKLAVALNGYAERHGTGRHYDFHEALKDVRETARELLTRFEGSRAYDRPAELVAAVAGESHQLAASIQYESGARVHEISLIRAEALRGIAVDRFTGEKRGYFAMEGKGGKEGLKAVSVETYQRLEQYISQNGAFRINEGSYRESLRKGAEISGQRYEGSHGLRWNWAQERYETLQNHGLNELQAMCEVSREMGHERGDITMHYLRGKE